MNTETTPAHKKVLTDAQCDAIYAALNDWAREIDSYDFGLPQVSGGGMEGGRPIIRAALASLAASGAPQEAPGDAPSDVERGRFFLKHAEWYQSAGRTFLALHVADGADLSCLATRRNAIDAAMKGPQ